MIIKIREMHSLILQPCGSWFQFRLNRLGIDAEITHSACLEMEDILMFACGVAEYHDDQLCNSYGGVWISYWA